MSISGTYAIVGTPSEDEDVNGGDTKQDAGSVYIYERDNNGQWPQVQKIVALDRDINDGFGVAVAISGDNAVVGLYQLLRLNRPCGLRRYGTGHQPKYL